MQTRRRAVVAGAKFYVRTFAEDRLSAFPLPVPPRRAQPRFPLKMGDDYQAFVKWFQNAGGAVDLTSMGLTDFPASEGGRGAVALKDLEVSSAQAYFL